MSALPSENDWVLVAKIVRPQGRHGEVIADLLTDFPERFAERKRLFLLSPKAKPQAIELEEHWLHQGRIVLKLSGIESINDAETLRGLEVAVPKEERLPLEDGAVYISDLLGCQLADSRSGQIVGRIADVDRDSGPTELLVVTTDNSDEVLVPFVKAYKPFIDLASKRITMELPEGLLDLNSGK